jgi:hypothetical protein
MEPSVREETALRVTTQQAAAVAAADTMAAVAGRQRKTMDQDGLLEVVEALPFSGE